MEHFFFDSWQSLLRTFVITILAYVALIFILRATGKRTLSKMNAFDFIVTIALGSSLATVALSKSVPLADGVLAFLLLVLLQYAITWLSVRYKSVKSMITSTPALILYKGEMLRDVMKKERVTTEELKAKAREQGYSSLNDIDAIVLETTGDITVISSINNEGKSTMDTVKYYAGKMRN